MAAAPLGERVVNRNTLQTNPPDTKYNLYLFTPPIARVGNPHTFLRYTPPDNNQVTHGTNVPSPGFYVFNDVNNREVSFVASIVEGREQSPVFSPTAQLAVYRSTTMGGKRRKTKVRRKNKRKTKRRY